MYNRFLILFALVGAFFFIGAVDAQAVVTVELIDALFDPVEDAEIYIEFWNQLENVWQQAGLAEEIAPGIYVIAIPEWANIGLGWKIQLPSYIEGLDPGGYTHLVLGTDEFEWLVEDQR